MLLVRHVDPDAFPAAARPVLDLANRTSNAIYARVGCRPLSGIWHYDLVDPEAG